MRWCLNSHQRGQIGGEAEVCVCVRVQKIKKIKRMKEREEEEGGEGEKEGRDNAI